MSDSIERLYQAVLAARHLDPATSRTARLFQRGPAKMAKKVAEEAIEVALDSVGGDAQAMVRESADLLYNLAEQVLAPLHLAPDVGRADGAAREPARHCRKAAEVAAEDLQDRSRPRCHPATDRRAGRPQSPQTALVPSLKIGPP